MKASLHNGVVCIELDGGPVILDTGSPVSLGDGSTYRFDGIACQTQPSLLLYSWDSVRESIPFNASALIGTDQLEQSAFKLDVRGSSFEWIPSLKKGKPLRRMTGIPLVDIRLMETEHSFFLDTGASITYVTDESMLSSCTCVGDVDDFHPLIGKFTSRLYEAMIVFAGETVSTKIGVLPRLFSMSMEPFGVTGILGTDVLEKGVLSIDLNNELFGFAAHSHPQTVPHDSWASDYDALFDASFGLFLEHFTDLTVVTVKSIVPAPAAVLDVGAGTGRLSIPLADAGYSVTAVDPSSAMLEQLASRLSGRVVRTVASPIENFSSSDRFDIAVCVFTVSSYWLTEQQLRSSLSAIYDHLVPGGSLVIDRTSEAAFADTVVETDFVRREARVTPLGANMYRFTENSEVIDHNVTRTVSDSFEIRYWTEEQLLSVADTVGFSQVENLSDQFVGSGASFYRLIKATKGAE